MFNQSIQEKYLNIKFYPNLKMLYICEKSSNLESRNRSLDNLYFLVLKSITKKFIPLLVELHEGLKK